MSGNTLDNTGKFRSSSASYSHLLIRILCKLGTISTGLIAIVAGLLYAKQESLLYFPEISGIPRRPSANPRHYRSPAEYDIPFTEHMITTRDGVSIHAWLLLQKSSVSSNSSSNTSSNDNKQSSSSSSSSSAPTVIFFHGNAGNIGLRLPNAAQMYNKLGCNIFMVEYRGYGDSQDCKPTEQGLKLDAEAAYNYLLNINNNITGTAAGTAESGAIDTSKIFIFGRSLGGAVAFHLAKYIEQQQQLNTNSNTNTNTSPSPPLKGIIVENTFTSISKMVDTLMPAIAPLKFLVLRMDWNSENIAPILNTPVLYLAGQRDELVPHSQMRQLFQKSLHGQSVYAKMHIIRNGTHNDSWVQGGREYYHAVKSFMSHVILHGDGLLAKSSSINASARSVSSFDDGTNTNTNTNTVSSMEVTMGGEQQQANQQRSIPIMPSNIIGMAKEAASKSFTTASSSSSSNASASDKKKER